MKATPPFTQSSTLAGQVAARNLEDWRELV